MTDVIPDPNAPTGTAAADAGTATDPNGAGQWDDETRDYIGRLRSESRTRKDELKEAQRKLQEHEDANKSELEKAQSTATAAQQAATAAELKALRYEIAAAAKIPLDHAQRLQGSTKEELEADAETYAKSLGVTDGDGGGGSVRRSVDTGAGVRRPNEKPQGMNGLIRQAVRGG